MREEYTVSGSELKDRVKQLLKEGNVFRLVIRRTGLNVRPDSGHGRGGGRLRSQIQDRDNPKTGQEIT